MSRLQRLYDHGLSPNFMRRFNFWAMVLFIALIPPSVLLWSASVPYLVVISVWANIAGHLSAWQSSRVEERQEDGAENG
jgi:general stress protein CsbA